jgi:hypothetical protein
MHEPQQAQEDKLSYIDKGERVWHGIPERFWPRCKWCNDFLGVGSMKSSGPYYEDRKICEACKVVIYNTIEDLGGYIIGELLSKHGDGASKDLTELGPDDVEKMARENMRARTLKMLYSDIRALN